MLGGFNTNVPYKNKTYHVQTEDGGTKHPVLTTHLYYRGAILLSEKHNYAELLIEDDWKDKVIKVMKDQHKMVIKNLLAGKYTGDAEEIAEEEIEETGMDMAEPGEESLEETLLEYIISREE